LDCSHIIPYKKNKSNRKMYNKVLLYNKTGGKICLDLKKRLKSLI
jgi:hypothetical protein